MAQLPKAVRETLAQSDTFCMELLPDITTKMTFAKSMAYGDEHPLVEAIGQSFFDQIAPLMLQQGIPTQALIKLKPWVVYMTF